MGTMLVGAALAALLGGFLVASAPRPVPVRVRNRRPR
jgi:hypothetical protein